MKGQRFAELHARQKSSTYYATGYNVIAKYSRISLFLWAPGLLLQAICIVLMDRMAINALGQKTEASSPLLAVGLEGGILGWQYPADYRALLLRQGKGIHRLFGTRGRAVLFRASDPGAAAG